MADVQFKDRAVYPLAPDPQPKIDTRSTSARDQVAQFSASHSRVEKGAGLAFLHKLATTGGNLCDVLDPGVVARLGQDAVTEWRIDQASRLRWEKAAERGLKAAAQESAGDDSDEEVKTYPFENASDVSYPLLTTAAIQFNSRALPEIIKGDKVVGVRTFNPPPSVSPSQVAEAMPAAPTPDAQQGEQQMVAGMTDQAKEREVAAKAKGARAERVAHYLNFLIFYRMDNWEGETDQLFMEAPITGAGFKKVYMGEYTLESDYVSALRLTVNASTRSMQRCPRITQDFDIYPYEIERGIASGQWRNVVLEAEGDDPERPRLWIEQHRMDDLDGDGLAEPYILTVDVQREETMRIEAAYAPDDIKTDDAEAPTRAIRIDRWVPFPAFMFLPDPKGEFYGMGLASLLENLMAVVDTSINQLVDAGNAEIAGGGFIGAGVRLQGSGQGGALWFRPGEYQVVSAPGGNLQQAIWERTTPHPSSVSLQMLELLLAAAKDISSAKDVVTGDGPTQAPVGTTLALQNQALQVFSAIYKRFYRGLKDEFQLMFHCLRRWATSRMRMEYEELTGGRFEDDFSGDGTDIQPIADPSVVTKMQKISRFQTLMQIAESPVGMAAGMQQPGPAQAIVSEGLALLDWDQPERFIAQVPPNPELLAKVQEMAASASLKQADAALRQRQAIHEGAKTNLDQALTVNEMGEVGERTHRIHQQSASVAANGLTPPSAEAPNV